MRRRCFLSPHLLTTNAFRTRFAGTKEAAICLYYETAGFAGYERALSRSLAYIYSPWNLNLDALLLAAAATTTIRRRRSFCGGNLVSFVS